jgi:uncharacterized protein (DUF4415 family)
MRSHPINASESDSAAKRGLPGTKKLISLRVDPDVLEWFRAQGPGYQTRMNAVLRAFMTAASKPR